MDVEPKFCYLGDMLCGDCELAVITRCSVAWGKFKKLLPILTSKHTALESRGKLYTFCVRSVLLYDSENWALKYQRRAWTFSAQGVVMW